MKKYEKNMSTVRSFMNYSFNERSVEKYNEFCAKSIKIFVPPSWEIIHSSMIKGLNNTVRLDSVYVKAFKTNDFQIEDIFCSYEDDQKIVVRWTCESVHVGDYFGIKATNKTFSVCGTSIYLLDHEGKITEAWQNWDMLGLLHQIEVLDIKMPIE